MLAVILLATYNGDAHLEEQLDSILEQTHAQWLLLAKDDGSTDETVEILQRYRKRFPEKMLYLGSSERNLGPALMFSSLIQHVLDQERELQLDDYCIALCDQDDVWHRDRLRITVDHLQSRLGAGPVPPLLIHSDLSVIDANGATLASRFSDYQGVMPRRNDFIALLALNVVTGCTTLMTPALARACTPVPEQAYMHDWWIALVASLVGEIHYIEQPLVGYRQHGGNTLGAREFKPKSRFKAISELVAPGADVTLRRVARQASWIGAHPPCRLTALQWLACRIVGGLMRPRSMLLRAAAFKLIRHLSTFEAWQRGRAAD
jgi:glycosyltransferase involved in cell wall biosynthesis